MDLVRINSRYAGTYLSASAVKAGRRDLLVRIFYLDELDSSKVCPLKRSAIAAVSLGPRLTKLPFLLTQSIRFHLTFKHGKDAESFLALIEVRCPFQEGQKISRS